MKFCIAASLAVLLAACGPQAPATAPRASASATPTEAAAAKRMPLPDCAAVATQDDAAYKDCRLMDEKSGLGFEARFAPAPADGAERTVTVSVVHPGDATLQTITENVMGTISVMELQDLDADGYKELLVPLSTGNVNTNYAIWHMPAGAKQFIRVGEVSGYGVGQADGFVTVNSRSAANIQNLDYYTLKNGELKHIAMIEFTASGDPDKPTVKCAVTDGKADDPKGGLATASMTRKAATAKWCGEDARKAAFQ